MNWIDLRKELHCHPEVSGQEHNTSGTIVSYLKKIGIHHIHQGFSEHSLIAEVNFNKPGKTILFRCELDALPITESNTFSHKSKNEGVSHKCGHDGHMSIMLGLAEKLKSLPLENGRVMLLFQSSEENGVGAKSIVHSKKLKEFEPIDRVISLHNVPRYKENSIICKPNNFTPSVESLDIHLLGKESHAGMPENGISPAGTVAQIINYFSKLHDPDQDSTTYFLATPIQINMGRPAYGTAFGEGVMSYTLRTWDYDLFQKQKADITDNIKTLVDEVEGLSVNLDWKEAFDANVNDEETVKVIRAIAEEKGLTYINKETPFSWGEDFGTFTQEYKGAMFGLGSGLNTPELHNPDYDFPDKIRETGIDMFYAIAKRILK